MVMQFIPSWTANCDPHRLSGKIMKCVMEGNGVKVFGKAVHALSRVGDEIWLDPLEKGLAVRTVNKTHSAYACFLFSPMFFQYYTLTLDQQLDKKSAKCQISIKSVLPLFRSLPILECSVYRCEITINNFNSKVVFQFKCRNGITKTHNLGYQECEALQAVFPAHLCPNILRAHPKLLSDIVMHFPLSQEEITLSISSKRVILKNYFEEDTDRIMFTEMFLHPDEFDYFHLKVDSNITFCLKELRGFLTFAEFHGLQLSVHFGSSGNPVSFSLKDMLLEAVVVLATLLDPASIESASLHNSHVAAAFTDVAVQHPADTVVEQVESSQGSLIFRPSYHVRKVMDLSEGEGNFSKSTSSLNDICSLLFGAVTNNQNKSNKSIPGLVYVSDTEDDDDEDNSRKKGRKWHL